MRELKVEVPNARPGVNRFSHFTLFEPKRSGSILKTICFSNFFMNSVSLDFQDLDPVGIFNFIASTASDAVHHSRR